jgi:hypothetical protein
MLRKTVALLTLVSYILFLPSGVYSATLTKIGSMDVTGQNYNEWWYTGTNPTLLGTAPAESAVTVTINETSNTVTADASGNWSFTPTNMPQGDYQMSISSSAGTINFTLHAGQMYPGSTEATGTPVVSTGSGVEVPETGFYQTAGILLSVAAFLTALVVFTYGRYSAIPSFERRVVQKL